jgi:hypothetical protein
MWDFLTGPLWAGAHGWIWSLVPWVDPGDVIASWVEASVFSCSRWSVVLKLLQQTNHYYYIRTVVTNEALINEEKVAVQDGTETCRRDEALKGEVIKDLITTCFNSTLLYVPWSTDVHSSSSQGRAAVRVCGGEGGRLEESNKIRELRRRTCRPVFRPAVSCLEPNPCLAQFSLVIALDTRLSSVGENPSG